MASRPPPRGPPRPPAPRAPPAALRRDRLLEHVGDLPGARRADAPRRVRGRGRDRRWAQRAASRGLEARRARGTCLRPEGRCRPGAVRRARPAVLACRRLLAARAGPGGPRSRGERRPGRHAVRSVSRVRPVRFAPPTAARPPSRRSARGAHRRARVTDLVPGGAARWDALGLLGLQAPAAGLRSQLPPHSLRDAGRHDQLSLSGRAGRRPRPQGGADRRPSAESACATR